MKTPLIALALTLTALLPLPAHAAIRISDDPPPAALTRTSHERALARTSYRCPRAVINPFTLRRGRDQFVMLQSRITAPYPTVFVTTYITDERGQYVAGDPTMITGGPITRDFLTLWHQLPSTLPTDARLRFELRVSDGLACSLTRVTHFRLSPT